MYRRIKFTLMLGFCFIFMAAITEAVDGSNLSVLKIKTKTYYLLENSAIAIIINNETGKISGFDLADAKDKLIQDLKSENKNIGGIQIRAMDSDLTYYPEKSVSSKIIFNESKPMLVYYYNELFGANSTVINFSIDVTYKLNPYDLEINVNNRLLKTGEINETIGWLYYFVLHNNITLQHKFEDLVYTVPVQSDVFFAQKYGNDQVYAQYNEVDQRIIVNRELVLPLSVLEDHDRRLYLFYGSYNGDQPIYFHMTPSNYFFGLFPSNDFRNTSFDFNHSFSYSFFITMLPFNYSMRFLLDYYFDNYLHTNNLSKRDLIESGISLDKYYNQMVGYDPVTSQNTWQIITNKYERAPQRQEEFPKLIVLCFLLLGFFVVSRFIVELK